MAREHPRYAEMEFEEYEFREFPMMYYPGAPDQAKPYDHKGKRLDGVLVQDEAEYQRLISQEVNLHKTASPGTKRIETVEDEKDALIVEAGQLGVKIDRKWGPARIADAISTHKRAQELARSASTETAAVI